MACDKIVIIKVIELVFCLACLLYMIVTDYESRQVFYRLEKQNREWPLLNSVTWEENGFIFTHAVFGSYVIITLGLLIGHLCGEIKHGRKMEKYFLGFGVVLFVIAGSLIYASLDSVPPHLVKNAAALGTLALLTALLFILDIGLRRPKPPQVERFYKATQTEFPTHSVDLLDKVHKVPNGNSVIGELRSSLKSRRRTEDDDNYLPHRDSIPDLTIHENGRRHSMISRGSPDEQAAPQSYQHSRHIHLENGSDNRRQPRGIITSESSFPPDIKLQHRDHPESYLSDEYIATDRVHEIHGPSTKDLRSPDSYLHGRRTSDDKLPLDLQHKYSLQKQEQSQEKKQDRHDASVRGTRAPDHHRFQRHLSSDQDTGNSNSSSGDQRYLEQSEVSQRPESITPEEIRRRTGIHPESDSEVDDLTRVPTVSFLLSERGELREVHPGGGLHSVRMKPPRGEKGSIKDTKLLPMMPISSTSKDFKSSLKARSTDTIADEPKRRPLREGGSPASAPDEREKERYLFGGRPKLSSNRSLDIEAGRLTGSEDISQTPSPDAAHWRYDSRDANLLRSERQLPSSPSDPGFVRHTAHNWPDSAPRTPSPSLAGSIKTGDARIQNWPSSHPRTASQSPQTWSESAILTPSPSQHVQWSPHQSSDEGDYAMATPIQMPSKPSVSEHKQKQTVQKSKTQKQKPQDEEEDEEEDADVPSGGSLTTQLLQKWLKQRKSKIAKSKSNP